MPSSRSLADSLRGQRLCIPDLRPAFVDWKVGLNKHYERVQEAVNVRLEGLIEDERFLAKVKASDLALIASRWFPDAPYDVLETAAFYCVWLFLWDDVIDGAAAGGAGAHADDGQGGLTPEEYCRESVAFARHHLGLDEPGTPGPAAPTQVCESFAEVARRVGEYCGLDERRQLFGHLREYMEACVVEHRWRLSGKMPSVDEFYSWRLRTSSVDVMLDLCRILNRISLPGDVLGSREMRIMHLHVNKLLILINELFSLKKELKDGACANLIPITMQALDFDLAQATQSVIQDVYHSIRTFNEESSALLREVAAEHGQGVADQLQQLIRAYQAIDTGVLVFSMDSPRYGLQKYRHEEDGVISYAVEI
ncbi:hypothetical protein VTK56DRAFT_2538 [Thermocarpiscus australiensis]